MGAPLLASVCGGSSGCGRSADVCCAATRTRGADTDAATAWRRHSIESLGFSIDVLEGVPVEVSQRATGGGISQAVVGADATLFVNWGEWASVEAFRESLSDLLTRPVAVADSRVEVLGGAGRRVCATLERGTSIASRLGADGAANHVKTPATRYCVEVISFVLDGVPVLVGYRVAQSSIRGREGLLRHFLTSVRRLDG